MTGQVALMLGVVACAAVLAAGEEGSFAKGANEEICRQFRQECSEARAQGARDAGICNVERLECTTDPTDRPAAGVGKRRGAWMHAPMLETIGKRSIGPWASVLSASAVLPRLRRDAEL